MGDKEKGNNGLLAMVVFVLMTAGANLSRADSHGQRVWKSGISDMAELAMVDSREHFAVYLNEPDGYERWSFVEATSARSDQVVVGGETLSQMVAEMIAPLPKNSTGLRVCLLHTHPLETIKDFIADPQKRPEVLREDVDYHPHGQHSIPPSRTDMATIISLKDIVWRQLRAKGISTASVFGVVVDPVGLYYFRPFHSRRERVSQLPHLEDEIAFSFLDNEAQGSVYREMSADFFATKVNWTTLLNQTNESEEAYLQSSEYRELQRSYGEFLMGTKLRFTMSSGSEAPCTGT